MFWFDALHAVIVSRFLERTNNNISINHMMQKLWQ